MNPLPIADQLPEALARATAIAERAETFAERLEALDLLELHLFDRLDGRETEPDSALIVVHARAMRSELESLNTKLVNALRLQIASGALRGPELRRVLLAHGGVAGAPGKYDALDSLFIALLAMTAAASPHVALTAEMVPFQPTPARAILALAERAKIRAQDAFQDLGSGFGAVPIFLSLLTGARAKGIEIEPTFCAAAVASARRLGAENTTFECADLRSASLADGDAYFLYTPLRGALLTGLLDRLEAEAKSRSIRVITLGPCTAVVAELRWLAEGSNVPLGEDEIVVFRSR